jgi:AraC-like DNA-binding protein
VLVREVPMTEYLSSHCRLITRDLDEARDFAARAWEKHDSRLRHGRKYFLKWHQADLSRTSLRYIENYSRMLIACGPVHHAYYFSMHEAGRTVLRIDGQEVTSTPAQAVVYTPGQELEMDAEPFRRLVVGFKGAVVEQALARRFNAKPPPLRTHGFPIDCPPAAALQSLCRWTAQELDRKDAWLLASPSYAKHIERALLSLLLDCIAPTLTNDKQPREDLARRQLEQIEEWLDRNFAEAIGVEDMAEIANVSVRAVQTAFQRLRGCTPTQAITRQRLEHACMSLRAPAPDTTVTRVAMDCGFSHLGRFARQYAQVFGERPSETLARARRAGAL